MRIARLPITVQLPRDGWIFHGPWLTGERAAVERTLRERIPNPTQARLRPNPGSF
jgi:hypothetical protein